MVDAREADRRRRVDRRSAESRRRDDPVSGGESYFDPAWLTAADPPGDAGVIGQPSRGSAPPEDTAFSRVLRTYAAARAAIGVGLVVAHGVNSLSGVRPSEWLVLISLAYAVQAISLWLLPRFRTLVTQGKQQQHRKQRWLATIGLDVLAFNLLHLLEVGATFNYAALLVLPVFMAGVLTTRLLALGTTSAVALLLLFAAWRAAVGGEGPALMLQSGLAGMGLFMITVLAGELAQRLAREELAARGSLLLARQQAQLNRLVIEEMADGVLVVDSRLMVRAVNPAARALLVDQGLSPPAPFMLDRDIAWSGLLDAARQALAASRWPEAGQDVTLNFGDGHTRTLRMRVRFMRGRSRELAALPATTEDLSAEPVAVLLLEDLRTLQARIRQEKLAAMGRVSAGIAHEIRNPLAAISQANALMIEDPLSTAQRRLATIVGDNVARLKRLVDDVMEVAPGTEPLTQAIDAAAAVREATSEWARTMQLPLDAESRLRVEISADPQWVDFDPEHLRRVLVNLLDNAYRHASQAPGSIFLRLAARDEQQVVLAVLSDAAPLAPDVERRLFEPFFSTRSRGSGLGLYICRELCERYGASIEYRPRPAAERLRNEFIVTMRRADLGVAAPAPSRSTPDTLLQPPP